MKKRQLGLLVVLAVMVWAGSCAIMPKADNHQLGEIRQLVFERVIAEGANEFTWFMDFDAMGQDVVKRLLERGYIVKDSRRLAKQADSSVIDTERHKGGYLVSIQTHAIKPGRVLVIYEAYHGPGAAFGGNLIMEWKSGKWQVSGEGYKAWKS